MLEVLQEADAIYRHEGMFDRSQLTVTYSVNRIEHEARVRSGLREIRDEFLLAALLDAPEDRLDPVSQRFERVLRKADSAHLVTILEDPEGGLWAQRRVQPAVEVRSIEITSASVKHGCTVAHRWAGYAPLTITTSASVSTFELTKVSHFGIGLQMADGDCVMRPATFAPQRWSSARWRFAELVYGQFRDLND
ncbi:hypothetical protein [Pseudoclavibacter helvolus]|uniref:hypothetical protein n=1 Tax=Pseudoclavibacter helvolus TaxID=255205 RepID=UPI000837E496|nr:hypothetical protein [Pseudoclavibacter helvolus]